MHSLGLFRMGCTPGGLFRLILCCLVLVVHFPSLPTWRKRRRKERYSMTTSLYISYNSHLSLCPLSGSVNLSQLSVSILAAFLCYSILSADFNFERTNLSLAAFIYYKFSKGFLLATTKATSLSHKLPHRPFTLQRMKYLQECQLVAPGCLKLKDIYWGGEIKEEQ